MKELDQGICSLKDVSANGCREKGKGLCIINASGKTVGVFTKNKVKAAPVRYTQEILSKENSTDYLIANSGCANAFNGEKGYKDAEWMASLTQGRTVVCSTGLIGKQIDRDWIKRKANYLKNNLREDKEGSYSAADAIRTTDTFTKEVAIQVGDVKVTGLAKGSGMIEPNMGTMLAFLYTNADFSTDYLKKVLRESVENTFNMVTVDGDTSTNDTVLLTSTEKRSDVSKKDFEKALNFICNKLAKMIAKDGEGSTKLITTKVSSARTKKEAKNTVKEVLNSSLVKTMFFGENSNLGRLASAIGNSSSYIEEKNILIKLNQKLVIEDGKIVANDSEIEKELEKDEITVNIDLGLGEESAKGWGCDLSPKYVEMNSEYA